VPAVVVANAEKKIATIAVQKIRKELRSCADIEVLYYSGSALEKH
jgi:hypothetical protein